MNLNFTSNKLQFVTHAISSMNNLLKSKKLDLAEKIFIAPIKIQSELHIVWQNFNVTLFD